MTIVQFAAQCVKRSSAVLLTSGAGMSADSGLPTFRSTEGLWKAYPFFKKANMSFVQAANPNFMRQDPKKFWYFYGHRYNLYAKTKPHDGFQQSLNLSKNYFVYTSNVDGHYLKSGCDQNRIVECHGSIVHNQCQNCWEIYKTDYEAVEIDEKISEATQLPKCPVCKSLVRPNVLMFNDMDWIPERTEYQKSNYSKWLNQQSEQSLVIIESGAGEAVLTIRMLSENILLRQTNAQTILIRINPEDQCSTVLQRKDPEILIVDENTDLKRCDFESKKILIKLKMGAKNAFEQISQQLQH